MSPTRWFRVILVVVLMSLVASPVAAKDWHPEQLVTIPVTSGPAVAFDGAGRPHLAFASDTGIWYQVDEGKAVRVPGTSRRSNLAMALALRDPGSRPRPRIVWVDGDQHTALWVSDRDSGTWKSRRVWEGRAWAFSVVEDGRRLAIALLDDKSHLRVMTWDPVKGPSKAVIVDDRCCSAIPVIGASKNGLWVAYEHYGSPGSNGAPLRLAHRNTAGKWTRKVVDKTPSNDVEMTFPGSDVYPTVVYLSGAGDVRRLRRQGGKWQARKVVDGPYRTIAVASDRNGHVGVVMTRPYDVDYRRIDVPSATVRVHKGSSSLYFRWPSVYLDRNAVQIVAKGFSGETALVYRFQT